MPTSHFSALEAKHSRLDTRIAAESRRPQPDSHILAELKKQKLRVKEAIAQI